MKTACELCTEIAIKEALHEEEKRIEKIKIVENFIEDIISPIIDKLYKIPNQLKIGYRYAHHDSYTNNFYTRIGDWRDEVTYKGNPKQERCLKDKILVKEEFRSYLCPLDYDLLNQYLAQYGYQIFVESKSIAVTLYSTRPNSPVYADVDVLYLSLLCPLEEENKNNA